MDGGLNGARPRLLMVVNNPAFFLSHIASVAETARAAGWEVHVATAPGPEVSRITALGFPHHPVPIDRGGVNPMREVATFRAIYRLTRDLRPEVMHATTIKPVIWGNLAARAAGVPGRIAAITGMGYVFIQKGAWGSALRSVIGRLYRSALGGPHRALVFENPTDRETVGALGVDVADSTTIPMSGVALDIFRPAPEPDGPPVVVLPARILAHKGVREFVEASRILKAEGVEARFIVAGTPDPGNPAQVPEAELDGWRREGTVEFPGFVEDMPALLAAAHLVVLPSYREGLPKALTEAAAAGRAVVTTDTPGCRDAIAPGESGLLVPAGDAAALADAMRTLLTDKERRQAMGRAGRALAERSYDIREVAQRHLALLERVALAARS